MTNIRKRTIQYEKLKNITKKSSNKQSTTKDDVVDASSVPELTVLSSKTGV
jgi:hypothetical protein